MLKLQVFCLALVLVVFMGFSAVAVQVVPPQNGNVGTSQIENDNTPPVPPIDQEPRIFFYGSWYDGGSWSDLVNIKPHGPAHPMDILPNLWNLGAVVTNFSGSELLITGYDSDRNAGIRLLMEGDTDWRTISWSCSDESPTRMSYGQDGNPGWIGWAGCGYNVALMSSDEGNSSALEFYTTGNVQTKVAGNGVDKAAIVEQMPIVIEDEYGATEHPLYRIIEVKNGSISEDPSNWQLEHTTAWLMDRPISDVDYCPDNSLLYQQWNWEMSYDDQGNPLKDEWDCFVCTWHNSLYRLYEVDSEEGPIWLPAMLEKDVDMSGPLPDNGYWFATHKYPPVEQRTRGGGAASTVVTLHYASTKENPNPTVETREYKGDLFSLSAYYGVPGNQRPF